MGAIVLIDTCVYLNILDVPTCNQDRQAILSEFETKIKNGDIFLMPFVAILETGNHIANLRDSRQRHDFAEKFVSDIRKAVIGDTPYRPTSFPEKEAFLKWLTDFPRYAQRSKMKKADKPAEGISLSDLSIIKEYEAACQRHSMSEVLIWSLDSDLTGYHRPAKK